MIIFIIILREIIDGYFMLSAKATISFPYHLHHPLSQETAKLRNAQMFTGIDQLTKKLASVRLANCYNLSIDELQVKKDLNKYPSLVDPSLSLTKMTLIHQLSSLTWSLALIQKKFKPPLPCHLEGLSSGYVDDSSLIFSLEHSISLQNLNITYFAWIEINLTDYNLNPFQFLQLIR